VLSGAVLASSVGDGMFMTSSMLYFTRVAHLSAARVGLGLALAGVLGLLAGVPVGDLADRHGPRAVQLTALLALAGTMTGYLLVTGFGLFVLVACLDAVANAAALAAQGALCRRVAGDGAAGFQARLRALTNAGIAVGALASGVAIQIDTRAAYQLLLAVNVLTFLLCAVIVARLPRYPPLPRPARERRWAALADRPFVAYAALNGAMCVQYMVLMTPLPLWITLHTRAPRWSVAGVMLLNTVLCVLLQVRVGSRVTDARRGGAALRTAGCVFLVSCALFAALPGLPVWPALAVLLLAVVVHTWAELWHASAQFALGFGLAPEHAQGQYQGLEGMGFGAGIALAPAVLTLLCLTWGRAGWIALGCGFALLGLSAPALTRWVERTRPEFGVAARPGLFDDDPPHASVLAEP
jgi:MFS family permease